MQKLNLPEYPFRISKQNNKRYIFDEIRKKNVLLTPEEWVRQHFIQYLIQKKDYPVSLMAIEKKLVLNQLEKRADIVVFNSNAQPLIIIECKAAEVELNQSTFEQVARYNINYKAPYLIITNGLMHFCCYVDFLNNSVKFVEEIPSYDQLKVK